MSTARQRKDGTFDFVVYVPKNIAAQVKLIS